jgi:hypothetical protein
MKKIGIYAILLVLAGCDPEYRDVYTPIPEGIPIADAETLAKIGAAEEYPLDGIYYLAEDIDLSGHSPWTPIGSGSQPFRGVFDGRGKRISGLALGSEPIYNGLFGYVSYARIENLSLSLESADLAPSGAAYIGAAAGRADRSLLRNIEVSGNDEVLKVTASGTANIGGLTGYLGQNSKAERIYADLSVRGSGNGTLSIGGIAGRAEAGSLVLCRTAADRIEGEASTGTLSVGGIAGSGTMSLQDCEAALAEGVFGKNTGAYGDIYLGGLVGKADEENPPRYALTQSRLSGEVSVKAETQDANHTGAVYAGGLAGSGRVLRGLVQDAVSVSVSAAGKGSVYAGGLVGSGTIHESAFPQPGSVTVTRNARYSGSANTQTCVGGLVGQGNCLNAFSCADVRLTTNFRENVSASGDSPYCAVAGGAVGSSNNGGGQIENAYTTGTVTLTNHNAAEYVSAGGVAGLVFYSSGTIMSANVSLNRVAVTAPDAGKIAAHRSAGKITGNPTGAELDSNAAVRDRAAVTVNAGTVESSSDPAGLDGSSWNDKGPEFEGSVFEWLQWDYEKIWKWDPALGRPVLRYFVPEEPETVGGN